MSQSEASVPPPAGGIPRLGLARAASYNAALHIRDLHGAPPTPAADDPDAPFEVITPEGKRILIKHSGIVHTISHNNCASQKSALRLIATLFYNPSSSQIILEESTVVDVQEADENYGAFVSDMALFEFIQMVDELLVPWRKFGTSHRCLDSDVEPKVMEVTLSMPEMLQLDELRRHLSLWEFEKKWNVEVVLQENNVWRRNKRLAVFDMDSTLIEQEVIDEIAANVGAGGKVSEITARAMNGELDFSQSLRERVALLQGTPVTVLDQVKASITFTPGARELCKALKTLGYKLAVLSGGFMPLAEYVKEELCLDYAFANNLVVSEDNGTLTGGLSGPIVDATRKADLLVSLAKENDISLSQTLAVGDGANDLLMMKKAGLGVAFNAKPAVQAAAPARINSESLLDVMYVMGFSREEVEMLVGGDA